MTSFQHIELSEETFNSMFSLVFNHLDANASFDGYAFETFGDELTFVKKQPINRIWTIVEGVDHLWIQSGYHYVNRLCYLVSEEPVPDNMNYFVRID